MFYLVLAGIALLVTVFCLIVYWFVRERTKSHKKVDTGQAIRW
jgi:hypothetical protein